MTVLLEPSPLSEESPLVGRSIDLPAAGERVDGYQLVLHGWALGRSGPPEVFEIRRGRLPTVLVAPNRIRPDVAAAFPDVADAGRSGFEARISLLGLPPRFEIRVSAVFDGAPVEVGVVGGTRAPLRLPPPAPGPLPVLMTTLGRSGSTWLSHVLGRHPAILCYRPFELEPRAVGYWTSVLRSLSEPASSSEMLRGVLGRVHWWLGDPEREQVSIASLEPGVQRLLTRTSVESTAAFCRWQIQEFYASVAGAERPRWFVEKADYDMVHLCRDLFPETRELVLVRDFRDLIPSVIAFNRKQGFESFGRELVASDLDFIGEMRSQAVALLTSWKARRGDAHLVRYEDLILEPEATLGAILAYLDVDSSPDTVADVVRRARTTSEEMQAAHRTSTDPAASIGRWRRDLSPELQAACEEAFADLLPEFGYAR